MVKNKHIFLRAPEFQLTLSTFQELNIHGHGIQLRSTSSIVGSFYYIGIIQQTISRLYNLMTVIAMYEFVWHKVHMPIKAFSLANLLLFTDSFKCFITDRSYQGSNSLKILGSSQLNLFVLTCIVLYQHLI